ncbi:MAG: 30S ribosome-binding factor RbfA [Candidatus Paceibacterota bacterium]
MFHRPERVSSLIQEELGKIISREVEFPECLVTITSVDVDNKLDRAVVNFSVIPSKNSEEVLKILKKAAGHLQHLLLEKLSIKPLPRIFFEIDYGSEKAAEVEKLLMEEDNK